MHTDDFFIRVVEPNLQRLFAMPEVALPVTDEARVMMMAIAGQESGWRCRKQVGGPARSYWQFEKMGGVAEVLQKCTKQISGVCKSWDIPVNVTDLYEAMAWHDPLAVAMARLLLWQDAAPLPAIGDKTASWNYYLRNWRPGMPHPEAWSGNYDKALSTVQALGTCSVDPRQGKLGI